MMETGGNSTTIESFKLNKNSSSVLLFMVTFALTYWMIQSRQNRRRYPPALRSLPIIGSAPFLPGFNDLPEFFRQTAINLKSSVFSIYQGSEYTIVINGREAIREALLKHSVEFADRFAPYSLRTFFNPKLRGIIQRRYTDEFKKYHQLTLGILREFGFGQRVMEERILTEGEDLIDRINALKGAPFDPSEYLNMCTINVINSIAFGNRLPQAHPTIKDMSNYYRYFVNCVKRLLDYCPSLRFVPKYWSQMKKAISRYDAHHAFLLECIKESIISNPTDSFVGQFAEKEGDALNLWELKDVVNDLLLAGSENTATTLHWLIYFMANNPGIQKRIKDEISSVIPAVRLPSLEDMAKLPYLKAAMLECMRIRTVLPLSVQRATVCNTEVAGYFIPAKTRITPNLYSVPMDPIEFPEPEVYRPERFLDSEGHVINRDKIVLFGLGKRSCLGELLARQELFLLFSALVQRFNILPPEGQDKVVSAPKIVITLIPTPFLVRMVPVNN